MRELGHRVLEVLTPFAAALVLALAVGCQTPLGAPPASVPGIDPDDVELTLEVGRLDREIAELDELLGGYPVRFRSDRDRMIAHALWSEAVKRSVILLNVDLANPELFARAGNLYRHGFNLGVTEARGAAYRTLSRCIELATGHIDCHYRLAQLFLASAPRFAPNAEQLLLRARSLTSPQTRPELEAELARAYFAQGLRSKALHQIDFYLTLRPQDADARDFRASLIRQPGEGAGSNRPVH